MYGIFITGLGGEGNFDALAQETFPDGSEDTYQHSDRIDAKKYAGMKVVLVGHSLGAEAAAELVERLQEADAEVVVLMLEAPVHRNWSRDPFEVPSGVLIPICFNRDELGRLEIPPEVGFDNPIYNHFRNIGHADFPTDPVCCNWLKLAVQKLQEQP